MLPRILLTLCALKFGMIVPYLELDATHVFNPAWQPHARLHEVWQLATNSMIAAWCIWRLWWKADIVQPALFTFFVTGGFFVAYFTRGVYGGSMLHSDGTERLVMGVNIGVLGFGIAIAMTALALMLHVKSLKHQA
ncbi:MAG: hypothetical protein JNJ55_06575 [Betaproteobacteria bacterium]|nr:hypothetical protein [Betaproteobacteria bacterium]